MDIETEVLKVKALRLQRGDILVVRLGAGEYIVDEQAQHLKDTVERLLAKAGVVDVPVALLPDGIDFEVVTVLGTGRLKPPPEHRKLVRGKPVLRVRVTGCDVGRADWYSDRIGQELEVVEDHSSVLYLLAEDFADMDRNPLRLIRPEHCEITALSVPADEQAEVAP